MQTAFTMGTSIIDTLRSAGFESYFVGGCVRDMLLNITPQDYDIVTAASVEQVQSLFKRTVPVGASFGVILVIKQGIPFQVTAFRGESGSPEEDAHKRDFTINGLFYDYVKDRVIDYVDGKKDIAQKIIRAIDSPAERFSDDPLRMLRAIRIAVTRGFTIEQHTFKAIQEMAPSISGVSMERIRNELLLLFASRNIYNGMELLIESSLFEHILPEYFPLNTACLTCVQKLIAQRAIRDFFTGFSCFIFGMEHTRFCTEEAYPSTAASLLRRLRLSADDQTAIMRITSRAVMFKNALTVSNGIKKKWMQSKTFLWELEFHRTVLNVLNEPLTTYEDLKQLYESCSYNDLFPEKLITGKDLIQCGFTPSPYWTALFNEMELLQLDGSLTTYEQAEQWAKTFLR